MIDQPALPYHLSQLAEVCKDHPITPKFLFVASRQVGYNLLTTLARSGIDWINFEALSPREHAERRFEPLLQAAGLRPLHNDVALVVVADLLRELKGRDEGSYFEPVGVTPSLARSVWDTLQALRTAGIDAVDLDAAPLQTDKTRALAYLLRRLEEVLAQRRVYDSAYVLDYAVREGSGRQVEGVAVVMDETPMTGRSLRYLRQSFGDRLIRVGRDDYGVPIPATAGASFLSKEPTMGGPTGPGAFVKSRELDGEEADRVRVFGSKGPEEEVGDVVRYCLEHGLPLDDVEIAYSSGPIYVHQLADLADRLQLDVSFAEGVSATLTRPGAGLKGFLDWITGNCPAEALTKLMIAGVLSFHRDVDEVTIVDMPALTSHFRLAVLEEGIERYLPAIDRLAASRQERADHDDYSGERSYERRSRLLRRCIEDLTGLVPTASTLSIAETASICIQFLNRFSVVHGERDERAVESLRDRFIQFGQEGQTSLPTRLALQMAADMVERHTVQAATARPGSLHAVSIERAGYDGRRHLFVVGLDVDNFPGRAAEDPILLDVERAQLSAGLDLKSSQATDRIWHLVRAIGMAPGRVYFGSSTFNAEREEAVVYPSPFFQSVTKRLGIDYLEPPPLSATPFHFDDTRALLPQRRRSDYRRFITSRFPWMQEGGVASESRRGLLFSEFDGRLTTPSDSLQRLNEGAVFSPNRMEKLAACPYRYFLHYVLGIRKPDYYSPNPTRWLDPRDFGTLLHDLYYAFLKEMTDRDERPNPERDRDRLLELLDERIEHYRGRFPPDNQAAYEYERKRLEESALAFLRTEASDPDSRPVLFEFVFGSDTAQGEELARPVRIVLDEDLEFLLRGRIDRVDVLSNRTLAIWDYKTGSSYNFEEGNLLRGGLNLQWVLYAYALEELASELGLPRSVARSGYYFASDRENGRRIAESPPARAAMSRVLAPLFSLVRQGAFLHVTKMEGECKFCDFRSICSTEAKTKKDLKEVWMPNADLSCIDALAQWMETE